MEVIVCAEDRDLDWILRDIAELQKRFEGEIHVYVPTEAEFPSYDIERLPTVIYRVGDEEHVRFEGPFTFVSYFWQAVRVLRPDTLPRRIRHRKKKRDYELKF